MPTRYPNDDPPLRHVIDDILIVILLTLGACIAYDFLH